MDFKFISHKEDVINAEQEAIKRAAERIGQRAERMAKSYCPVDTGRLRNSITYATAYTHDSGVKPATGDDYATHGTPNESSVVIGTNVEYAPFVELGSSKRIPHPFLKPAIALHADQYRRILESELKGT